MLESVRGAIERGAAALGVGVSAGALTAMGRFAELLVEWNEQVNLTAITAPEEIARKHFVDSLSVLRAIDDKPGLRLVDVGSGAGFPGLVVAMARPQWRVLLVDALAKRVSFLHQAIAETGLGNVQAVHLRAEEAGRRSELREQFDVATARAVAGLPVLAEYCLPLVRPGGLFLAMKAREVEREMAEATPAVTALGAEYLDVLRFTLPGATEERAIVRIRKTESTPQGYPRRPGLPEKKPLHTLPRTRSK
ncbi:MAG: 16S rRNA (guanine(527)-N(7))-methyltransferase RsmG [Firmicutes bacterium]|nr:16S rRNA (guanine(527)-N(7))-methyltransferase RsmG [Bacillota bacterium]